MDAISLTLYVPFWCSFRQSVGINVHHTYPVPPKTTCYGLVANALGLNQDDYSLREKLKFAIFILDKGELIENHSLILKKDRNDALHTYYSTQVTKQKLMKPKYQLYISSDDEELLQRIYIAFSNPARILYLGESDDMVEIENLAWVKLDVGESDVIHSTVPVEYGSVTTPAVILKMPILFRKLSKDQYAVEQEVVYVPNNLERDRSIPSKLELDHPITSFRDGERYLVW